MNEMKCFALSAVCPGNEESVSFNIVINNSQLDYTYQSVARLLRLSGSTNATIFRDEDVLLFFMDSAAVAADVVNVARDDLEAALRLPPGL